MPIADIKKIEKEVGTKLVALLKNKEVLGKIKDILEDCNEENQCSNHILTIKIYECLELLFFKCGLLGKLKLDQIANTPKIKKKLKWMMGDVCAFPLHSLAVDIRTYIDCHYLPIYESHSFIEGAIRTIPAYIMNYAKTAWMLSAAESADSDDMRTKVVNMIKMGLAFRKLEEYDGYNIKRRIAKLKESAKRRTVHTAYSILVLDNSPLYRIYAEIKDKDVYPYMDKVLRKAEALIIDKGDVDSDEALRAIKKINWLSIIWPFIESVDLLDNDKKLHGSEVLNYINSIKKVRACDEEMHLEAIRRHTQDCLHGYVSRRSMDFSNNCIFDEMYNHYDVCHKVKLMAEERRDQTNEMCRKYVVDSKKTYILGRVERAEKMRRALIIASVFLAVLLGISAIVGILIVTKVIPIKEGSVSYFAL
ncbi:hypothetical protein NEMIN01_0719 [Nematocida minor]|uniref:uncharacterized protein n=1 Tax=Nematocida minor TaxID=1912983 RepID=UPI002220B936|nr:uncharacterized protein NEMIN01_0719 [Nematocida minor]KAI5189856.1 hypothetical protein NEMIN01_0719 [Nematocida minor]